MYALTELLEIRRNMSMNEQYQYVEKNLTPSIAEELIRELFNL